MAKSKLFSREEGVKYTPTFDSISVAFGCNTSAVLGKMILYAQMKNGVCQVSQDRLAFELGLSVATVWKATKTIEAEGLVIDKTPDLTNKVHTYAINENKIIEFDKKYEEAMEAFREVEQELIEKSGDLVLKKYVVSSNGTRKFRIQYLNFSYAKGNWYLKITTEDILRKLNKKVSTQNLNTNSKERSNPPQDNATPKKSGFAEL